MTDDSVRAFRVDVSEADRSDLRSRLESTRLPEPEPVPDQSQGVQSRMISELLEYWRSGYDLDRVQSRLNALPQFITEVDGLGIHFLHVRSRHEDALPMIVTHGWPGSVIEHLSIIDPLTDPTAHGGTADDAFHLVIPSLPGYGFSAKPAGTGWNPERIGRAWDALMRRLGYDRYVAQGGDWGAFISEVMARQAPEGLIGVHVNLLYTRPPEIAHALAIGAPAPEGMSAPERTAYEQLRARKAPGYSVEQGTRPQTIGYAMTDSPVGLAAWLSDHDARSYQKFADAFAGRPDGNLTRDEILDNITLYWLSATGASAARLYWEQPVISLGLADVSTPIAVSVFPDEFYQTPRAWVDRAYRRVIYYHVAPRGGHFAAWEEPELFAREIRAAFAALR